MTALKRTCLMLSMAALGGCAAQPAPEPAPEAESKDVAETAEAVTLRDCQSQLALCVRASRNLGALAECTADFGACGVQAARDLDDQRKSLVDCRLDAAECLDAADTAAEIRACRTDYNECADSVVTNAVETAIDAAQGAIDDAFAQAGAVIGGIVGTAGEAIDTLRECRMDAVDCLRSVGSANQAMYCQAVFNECAAGAIDIAESLIEPLPGPTPSEIIEGFTDCRMAGQDCLAGALTERDITACSGLIATCVDDAADLAEATVEEVDGIIDDLLPPGVPTPLEILECNNELAVCLLSFGLPLQCAAEARVCLSTTDAN